jgi:hypothetical protein
MLLGERYRRDFLAHEKITDLQSNWWLALQFFLARAFMRGRNDALSSRFLAFALSELNAWLRPADGRAEAFDRLSEARPYLDRSAWRLSGTYHRKDRYAKFKERLTANSVATRFMDTSKTYPSFRWADGSESVPHFLSNAQDAAMLLDVLLLVSNPGQPNIFNFLVESVSRAQSPSDGLTQADMQLRQLYQFGPKIGPLVLQDIYLLHSSPRWFDWKGLNRNAIKHLFPVDTWVSQVAMLLHAQIKTDVQAREFFITQCIQFDCDPALVAAGAWYLGINSLKVLVEYFLTQYHLVIGDLHR